MAYTSIYAGGNFTPTLKTPINYVPIAPKFNVGAVNDVPTLNKALRGGQITPHQWNQRFQQLQRNPAPIKPYSPGNIAGSFGNALNKVIVQPAKGLANAATTSERTAATGIARILPGGTNDITAQQKQVASANKSVNFVQALQKAGKINAAQAQSLIKPNLQASTQANKGVSKSVKGLPSKGRLAAGFAGTAADILTAGALPEIKGAATGTKVANTAIKAGSYGAAGGLNAAAGGGTKKQILENAAAGAALPALPGVLKAGGKGAQKLVGAARAVSERHPVFDTLASNTKAQNLSEALARARQPGVGPRSALDNHVLPEATQTATAKEPVAPKAASISDSEAGGVQVPKTNDYVKEQIKLQEGARKAGSPAGLGKITAAKSDAKTKLLDSFAPIEDTLNKSGFKAAPENNIKFQIDRALRADTIGAQYIKDKGLAKVIQNAPNTKELDQYLIAKHAADLEKQGIKTGRNLDADKQLVKDLGSKYEGHAQAVKQYSENLLDTVTNYGLISKETATHLKEKYPNYVPMNKIFGEGELPGAPKGTGSGTASIASQSVVQKIKGSTRQIESPLASLVDKTQTAIREGERNQAAKILTGYKDLPGNPFGLRELEKGEEVGNKPVVSYLDNGTVRKFETTPEIAAAAKSLNKEQLGLIGRILTVPTRVLRLGATGLNPAFALANVSKDTVSAFINSSHPLRSSVANPKVFLDALVASANHGSKRYAELVREGAGGTSFDIARNAPKQNIRAIRAEANLPSKVLYTVTSPARLLRAAENTIGRSEEFNRSMQYFGNKDAALKKGLTPTRARLTAADAARNNTVNFARAGDYGRVLNSVLPYFNAGLQGSRTLLRSLKDRPIQTTSKLAVSAFLPMAAVTAWNTSDPKRKAAYDDIKDYEKQGNFIIVPPHPVKDPKTGKWNVIKIPMSQEIANLNNIVRNGTEAAVKDGKLHVDQLIGNAVGSATSLNVQNPRQFVNQVTPQAIKPGVEALTNQNLYSGNKIVPDSQRNLPGRDQIGPGTSKTATKLGAALNLSPRQIDNAISTSAGGLGTSTVHGKSLGSQISGRFKGAQGQSQYDLADARFGALKKQLTALGGYKALTPADKAKALNRLQSSVQAAYVPQKDSKGKTKKVSDRNKATKTNPNLSSYLKAAR